MTILVTGAAGMIGSHLVRSLCNAGYDVVGLDRCEASASPARHVIADLADYSALQKIIADYNIDRVIHLAALAHSSGNQKLTYEACHHVNVVCAENVFRAAENIPLLFISTADVYGFTKDTVNAQTTLSPVTDYGKSKALAEKRCKEICQQYSIFRFQPVYTETIKRDIQKRYYLKYPKLAYRIGSGMEYEVLSISVAVQSMVDWCACEPRCEIRNIKDENKLSTAVCILQEKKQGRARFVLHIPKWFAKLLFEVAVRLTGQNKYTYLLNKAVNPLRTE